MQNKSHYVVFFVAGLARVQESRRRRTNLNKLELLYSRARSLGDSGYENAPMGNYPFVAWIIASAIVSELSSPTEILIVPLDIPSSFSSGSVMLR